MALVSVMVMPALPREVMDALSALLDQEGHSGAALPIRLRPLFGGATGAREKQPI
ncbi:MAG: hypothetical protein ACOY94_10225 [Bacillota bacterium]